MSESYRPIVAVEKTAQGYGCYRTADYGLDEPEIVLETPSKGMLEGILDVARGLGFDPEHDRHPNGRVVLIFDDVEVDDE